MTLWLALRVIRRAPRRFVLAALGVAFPVAMFAATLFFVDDASGVMTRVALSHVQVEMRAIATSLDANMRTVSRQLSAVPSVTRVQPFAATDVVVSAPGAPSKWTARLFAVDPSYFRGRPWLRVISGSLHGGALLDQTLKDAPGFAAPKSVTISLPGDAPPLALTLPVNGVVSLRNARTWFSIPYGTVQGDIVAVPRALVIDYRTFQQSVLPALKAWVARGGISPISIGSTDLPPVSLEAHVNVDHLAFPNDPTAAAAWSEQLRRTLERRGSGSALVADNAAEELVLTQADATNAKVLFLLLGIPGALVAGALGLGAASALAEAYRREEALIRLRGATNGQIGRLAAAQAILAGITGSVVGLVAAGAAVTGVTGRAVWHGVSSGQLMLAIALSLLVGALVTGIRLIRLRRSLRRAEVVTERRLLERGWVPAWRRSHLDIVAIGVGVAILGVNLLAGGLTQNPIEGSSLALSFYVLLAPIALWLGVTFLALRCLLALLARRASPGTSRSLSSWRDATLRWLGRRPARTAVALVLGALAVAFGAEVLAFAATYRAATLQDARAALGSDMRLTPGDPLFTLPSLGPGVQATSAFRLVPSRVGSDRKTILAIDVPSYQATSTMRPNIIAGQGPAALAKDPMGILVASEIAHDFNLRPGDTLPVTIFPDDFENSTNISFHVLGVYRSFPPTSPPTDNPAELVMSLAAFPRAVIVPPDFYLAKVAPGRSVQAVAAGLRHGVLVGKFQVTTIGDPNRRGLTALDLGGLGVIESVGGALVAAVGVAVLGTFLVLERRREFAVLQSMGADRRQVLTGPALEGFFAVAGSLAIGLPVGLGLGILSVRVLSLFFSLPPPLLSVPWTGLTEMAALVIATSALALTVALTVVTRVQAASVLREL
jgi:putative ABC transport system permease protein